jgi:hypothetical protein
MPITTRCSCGARFAAPDKLAGRRVKCPKCSQPVLVESTDRPTAASAPVAVKCQCGKVLKVPGKLVGKSIKCPTCGEAVRVPLPAKVSTATVGDLPPHDGVAALLDDADLNLSKTGRRCPECRRDLQPDDIICIQCGYNTETGKKVKVKKLEKGQKIGNIRVPELAAAGADAPEAVQSLVKLLNQAAALALLMAVGIVVYMGYQRMQTNPKAGTDAFLSVLTESGAYVLGGFGLLVTVPCAVTAKLVQSGKPVGRILSIVMGFVTLLGFPLLTLLGVLILKLALSPEVSRYCR